MAQKVPLRIWPATFILGLAHVSCVRLRAGALCSPWRVGASGHTQQSAGVTGSLWGEAHQQSLWAARPDTSNALPGRWPSAGCSGYLDAHEAFGSCKLLGLALTAQIPPRDKLALHLDHELNRRLQKLLKRQKGELGLVGCRKGLVSSAFIFHVRHKVHSGRKGGRRDSTVCL